MPSQEEYQDNLLKGIETENMETEVTKEPKMTGTEEETAKAPETPEPVEEIGTQVDMSDMDDLLQSALDAQKADSSEKETEASQPVAENTAILPEETASLSEDEINRLLQQSQEQSGDAPAQESNDANDDLIKMLENADDEGLSNILDQVTPETAQPEETAEREEDNGKRGKKKKEKTWTPQNYSDAVPASRTFPRILYLPACLQPVETRFYLYGISFRRERVR